MAIVRMTSIYFVCFLMVRAAFAQNSTAVSVDDDNDNYDENQPYCFEFTWIGPNFDKSQTVNTTCGEYLESTRAEGVPCRQPLVYTYDGSPPDMNYLWENHRMDVVCRQSRGLVCAKYSYSYNNEVQNVTYMCTKVSAKEEGPVTEGCFEQVVDEYEVELCVCSSPKGPSFKPCNSATTRFISVELVTVLIFLAIINNHLNIEFSYS